MASSLTTTVAMIAIAGRRRPATTAIRTAGMASRRCTAARTADRSVARQCHAPSRCTRPRPPATYRWATGCIDGYRPAASGSIFARGGVLRPPASGGVFPPHRLVLCGWPARQQTGPSQFASVCCSSFPSRLPGRSTAGSPTAQPARTPVWEVRTSWAYVTDRGAFSPLSVTILQLAIASFFICQSRMTLP